MPRTGILDSPTHDLYQNFLVGPDVPIISESGLKNLLVDLDFLEGEFRQLGRASLTGVFAELRAVSTRSDPLPLYHADIPVSQDGVDTS